MDVPPVPRESEAAEGFAAEGLAAEGLAAEGLAAEEFAAEVPEPTEDVWLGDASGALGAGGASCIPDG